MFGLLRKGRFMRALFALLGQRRNGLLTVPMKFVVITTLLVIVSASAKGANEHEYQVLQAPTEDIHRDRYRDAEESLRTISKGDVTALNANSIARLRAMSLLGLVLTKQARYVEAEQTLTKCLDAQERLLGLDQREVSDTLYNLAVLNRYQGRYVDAIDNLTRALAIRTRDVPATGDGIAEVLYQFAEIYRLRGHLEAAEAVHKLALEIRLSLDAESLQTAESRAALAFAYTARGRHAEARDLLTSALQTQERELGHLHSEVAETLADLAFAYEGLEDFDTAESCARQSLTIREAVFGPTHPTVGIGYYVLGTVYHYREQYRDAKVFYEKALAIRERALGPDHPGLAPILDSLATCYEAGGNTAEAHRLTSRARAIRDKSDPHVKLSLLRNPDLAVAIPDIANIDVHTSGEIRILTSSDTNGVVGHSKTVLRDGLTFITTEDLLESNPELLLGHTRCPYNPLVLALTGGGIKGAYQVGALWFLVKVLNCDIAHVFGSSTGAITAAYLAQANDKEGLNELVDALVHNYKLSSTSDIIRPHFLGKLRVFMPRSLGGVDGINTLDPLSRRLADQISPEKIRNLTVVTVSLQSGSLPVSIASRSFTHDIGMRPDDIRDVIVGSASIPVIVEPKKARFWVAAKLLRYEDDTITVESTITGLPDPRCEIHFENGWSLPCVTVKVERSPTGARIPEMEKFRWTTKLRLPRVSEADRARLKDLVSNRYQKIEGSRWVNDMAARLEFSTIHQLVDGGVTDFLPLRRDDQRELLDSEYKNLLILTTGEYQDNAEPQKSIDGGLKIGVNAFEYMWDRYQEETMSRTVDNALFLPLLAEARARLAETLAWRKTAEAKLDETTLSQLDSAAPSNVGAAEDLQASLDELITGRHPRILLIVPRKRLFKDPFDTSPETIRAALHHGCSCAAELYRASAESRALLVTNPEETGPQLLCDSLLTK